MFSLHTGRGPEAEFFQLISKQGYAKGVQGVSQQGTYCFTPSGILLGSDNSRDPARIGLLLKQSLARWESLSKDRRLRSETPSENPAGRVRGEPFYPKDGLVLRQFTRDIGSSKRAMGDMSDPWNTDTVWFRAAEVTQLIPKQMQVGARQQVPPTLVARLARLHLIDAVLGQPMPLQNVGEATLTSEITKIDGDSITLHLTGRTSAEAANRSMQTSLLGKAVYDRSKQRFTSFDLVGVGARRGSQKMPAYITGDTGSGTIGFAFTLASSEPHDRVAPALFMAYGWR